MRSLASPIEGKETGRNSAMDGNDIIGKFNPGLGAQSFDIDGSAKLIPKGSDFVFELHYTVSGKPTTDSSKVGLVLAKSVRHRLVITRRRVRRQR